MTGRIDANGFIVLEGITGDEATVLCDVLDEQQATCSRLAEQRMLQSADRRWLAEREPRGRTANIRIAGRLEAEAASFRGRSRIYGDLLRVLRVCQGRAA